MFLRKKKLLENFTSNKSRVMDLKKRLDFVSAKQIQVIGEIEELRMDIQDEVTSTSRLQEEQLKLSEKTNILQSEIDEIHKLCDSHSNKRTEESGISNIPPPEYVSPTKELVERKRNLLLGVEEIYEKAVLTQTTMQRKRTHLASHTRVALEQLALIKKSVHSLDEVIAGMVEERRQAEEAINNMTFSLNFFNMANMK